MTFFIQYITYRLKNNYIEMENGYHGDVGLPKTLHNYRIIFSRSDKRLEEEMTCCCFDYMSALTLYYKRIGDRYSEAKLIDIIPE